MKTEIVNTRYGPMTIFSDDPGCSRLIKEYGEYSPSEIAFLDLFLTPESWVVDIGANIGGLTLPFAWKAGKVDAFEPQAEVRQVLESNVKNYDNVTVHPFGIADSERVMYCGPETSNWGPNSTGSVQLHDEPKTEQVQVRTLDSFNLSPNLIKVDVEGMELHVISGAQETIKRSRPYIWMERQDEYNKFYGPMFAHLGYTYSTIDLPMFYPNNYNYNPKNIYPTLAHLSVFGIPNA